jgi:hypothetical protein
LFSVTRQNLFKLPTEQQYGRSHADWRVDTMSGRIILRGAAMVSVPLAALAANAWSPAATGRTPGVEFTTTVVP